MQNITANVIYCENNERFEMMKQI